MKNDLHKRIEETLNSLDNVERAEANPFLLAKIRHKLGGETESILPLQWSWRLAVVMATVVIMNVFTMQNLLKNKSENSSGAGAVATEYSISIPDAY